MNNTAEIEPSPVLLFNISSINHLQDSDQIIKAYSELHGWINILQKAMWEVRISYVNFCPANKRGRISLPDLCFENIDLWGAGL